MHHYESIPYTNPLINSPNYSSDDEVSFIEEKVEAIKDRCDLDASVGVCFCMFGIGSICCLTPGIGFLVPLKGANGAAYMLAGKILTGIGGAVMTCGVCVGGISHCYYEKTK